MRIFFLNLSESFNLIVLYQEASNVNATNALSAVIIIRNFMLCHRYHYVIS